MTSIAQRQELQNKIWKIANEVRGSVDGWDFKQFVLGTLFYRFISENFTNYIEGGDESVNYANYPEKDITPEIKDDAIKTKGYFIYPSQLFVNVAKTANTNPNLNTDLKAIFDAIESSANGYPSEPDIKGLFADFDTTSTRLGNTVESKNNTLAKVLKGIEELDFGNFEDNQIDLFGDAYEFLISNYAANAGKSGGEFFTPQHVSKLIAQLAMHKQDKVNKIYDPAAGSGSLLLQAKKHFDNHIIEEGFYGQEVNHTTYNLARMNMFLHNINYDKFNIALGNTLIDPHYGDEKPFDAIVSNPPYSIKWIGDDDPTLINDDRFAPAGVLAPKSKADFAFVLHALSYLSSKGRAAIVCFPGIFYRGGAEQKIRKYLVDNNFVETVISLAPNLFYGTSIAVNILVLSKHKTDNKTQFIDASSEGFFKKVPSNNMLTDKHIEMIMDMFDSKNNIEYVAKSIDNKIIAENDYKLSVNSYVETKDDSEIVDIKKLNAEIQETGDKINSLRMSIDRLIKDIGCENEIDFIDKFLNGVNVEWKSLDEIGIVSGAGVDKKKNDDEKEIKLLNYMEVYHNRYLTKDIPSMIVTASDRKIEQCNVLKGDIFFTPSSEVLNDIGNSAVVIEDMEGVVYSYHIMRLRLNIPNITTSMFVSYMLGSKIVQEQINKNAKGITRYGLTKTQWEKLEIPIPCPDNQVKSLEIQKEIVQILDTFIEYTTKLAKELTKENIAREKQYEYYRNLLLTFPKNKIES
ncbi:MAG: type I restriction-modification system subunit M [Clostridia bacterium]|nr:type I restriction-modification system subunit M [Clostridia bacterium]